MVLYFQFFASHIDVCAFAGTIALYAVIVSVACSQMEKLSLALINMKKNINMQEQIKHHVLHHQQILR